MRIQKDVKGLGNRSVLQHALWLALRSGLDLTILLSPDASGVWGTQLLWSKISGPWSKMETLYLQRDGLREQQCTCLNVHRTQSCSGPTHCVYEATQEIMVLPPRCELSPEKALSKAADYQHPQRCECMAGSPADTKELKAHLHACGTSCSDGERNLQMERENYMV